MTQGRPRYRPRQNVLRVLARTCMVEAISPPFENGARQIVLTKLVVARLTLRSRISPGIK